MAQHNGKFVAYYRVSTGKQGRSGFGIEAQRATVATYLNGGDGSIVAEHTEVESGKRSDRLALEQALAAARLHRAALVVSKVDRLTRSVAFEAGVDVRFADLPTIEGATGRFLLQQMVAVAELEAGMISKRTKDALAAAKRRGKVLGGNRGVTPSRKMQEASRKALPAIAALQAAGKTSLRAIAEGLNQQAIPTAQVGRMVRGAGRAGVGAHRVSEDLVDDFYKPLVQPLGNLVILCAQAEASLLRLIAALQGSDERAAQNLLKQKDAKEQLLAQARDRSGLEGFDLSELLDGIANYWDDRARRNRYYHDDWFVVLEEGGIPATRGLPLKKDSDVVFDDPTPGAIWGLAARFREHDHLFSHVTSRIERRAESPR